MNMTYSQFAQDEDWQELLSEFVANIPQRLSSLEIAMRQGDLEGLTSLVHQLKGACGSYGYHTVTPVAHQLEGELIDTRDIRKVDALFGHFCEVLRRITADAPPRD